MKYIRHQVNQMTAYTPGEQPRDRNVIKLNTNENPYPPAPAVRDVLGSFDIETLRRYPDPVCMELREVIAALHGCRVEQVFVGNGSDEVLAVSLRSFVERSGCVSFFNPSYSLYPILCDIEEIQTLSVPLNKDFLWSMPEIPQADLFFLTNPNAPTGIQYPKPIVESFCKDFSGVVLIDEAYVDFADDHCMDLALSMENVLVARTLSKSYSLAGLRLGYAVGPEALIAAMYKIKDSYNVDMLAQSIAIAAIKDQDYLYARINAIRNTRSRVEQALCELGWKVYPSQANFLWIEPMGIEAKALFEALRTRHIYVRYFPGERTGTCLRITIGTDVEMDRFINEVKRILSDQ